MLNEFKSFLKKELGGSKYRSYFEEYQKMDRMQKKGGEKIKLQSVYDEIYADLRAREEELLLEKQKRLREAMISVFQICRHYTLVVITYILAALTIVFFGPNVAIDFFSVITLSIVFLVKTYQFVVNKYSYLDAYIVIAYKAALEKCLSER